MTNKKRGGLFFLSFLILVVIIVLTSIYYYNYNLKAVNVDNKKDISFKIGKGSTGNLVARALKNKNLIKNEFIFKVYLKINKDIIFKEGSFLLNQTMDVKQIVKVLSGRSNDIVYFTLKEGQNIPSIAKSISKITGEDEKVIIAGLSDTKYLNILISKYSILDKVILDKNLYYPLEGYLFPETYQIERSSLNYKTIVEASIKMMDQNIKSIKKSSKYSVHEYLTLASMIELEAIKEQDRYLVSSVFHNRLDKKIKLGSDVTTYYGRRINMAERDVTKEDLNAENPYNTRGSVKALPLGPIGAPSLTSIKAAITPPKTDYLFFVADKYGNVFFTKTNKEHDKKVDEIKKKGHWITFKKK